MIKLLLLLALLGLGYQLLRSLRQGTPRNGNEPSNAVPPSDGSRIVNDSRPADSSRDTSRVVDAQFEEVDDGGTS